ncbi:MAG: restriction endonuclease [Thermodesulfobacteriota bacterium]|nr:restriction endonuclease [Thermodesulfobacteriota bacterium]
MIDNPTPNTWQDLQINVNQILLEIGLQSEIGKIIETPRGSVEIDVYAIDTNSVDQIKYIIECKNWANAIPQSVVHSFQRWAYSKRQLMLTKGR